MQTLSDFLYEYGLELKPHLTKNRILKVLQPLPKGFTLIPSFPLACFPNNNEVSKIRCDQCLGIKPLKTCSKCHKIFYCSSECQTLSWKYHHKKLCSIYANVEQGTNVDDDNDEKMEKEMLRRVSLIISNYLENLKKKDFSKVKTIDERTLINNILCETFLSLMTHRDEQPQTKLENYRKTASKVFAELKLTNLSEDDLINFLCKFYCNNFSIHDYQIFTFGDGTYPIGALINHSCRPNSIVMYDGEVQLIRTIEDISKGEEITISYNDIAIDKKSRQRILREKHFFRSGQIIEETDDNREILKNWLMLQLAKDINLNLNDTSKDEYVKSLDEFLTNLPLPDSLTHNPYSKLALSVSTQTFFEFIDSLEWNKASIIGKFILAIYLLIYPRFHPVIGLHLFTLGKCIWNDSTNNNEKVKQTVEILQLAKRVFEITHGVGDKNKEMIYEVDELLIIAQNELKKN
ncbi:13355_t:CDS:2 [Entrophospora sp. SA101]|nr:13355_t:CDS:2 [Entrophospora sp. SA101]